MRELEPPRAHERQEERRVQDALAGAGPGGRRRGEPCDFNRDGGGEGEEHEERGEWVLAGGAARFEDVEVATRCTIVS